MRTEDKNIVRRHRRKEQTFGLRRGGWDDLRE